MIRLSKRYQPHLAILLGMALVPVAVHSYVQVRSDDCAHPERLLGVASASTPDPERDAWVGGRFDADAWWSGQLEPERDGMSLEYTVIRSYNAKRLYHRADDRLLAPTAEARVVEWLDVDGTRIPIHRSFYKQSLADGSQYLTAYLLMHEGEAVANGYLAQLKHAPAQLIRGSRLMTLFMVSGEARLQMIGAAEQVAHEWLQSAWENYLLSCHS